MWTTENRGRYDRSKLRCPRDVTDDEWALIKRFIPPAKRGSNKQTVDVRDVVNGLMYILSTGCQWASLPKDLSPRSTVNDYSGPGTLMGRWTGFIMNFMRSVGNWPSERQALRRRS
jgi:transposase